MTAQKIPENPKTRPGKRQGAMIKNLCTIVKSNFKHPKLILGLFVVPLLIFHICGLIKEWIE